METTHTGMAPAIPPQTHPLLLLAAASVTALSLAGVAVLAGWLPGPGMRNAPLVSLASTPGASPDTTRMGSAAARKAVGPLAESADPPLVHARRSGTPLPAGQSTRAPAPAAARVPVQPPPDAAVSPAPTFPAAPPDTAFSATAPRPQICNECGVVEAVREVTVEARASGGGAIAGGLAGGLLGNQIGKGSGRSIATVLGAVGGAFAGNHIEKSLREGKRYEATVRFDDGSTRSFSSETPPAWQRGDRVRLQNGLLTMGGGKSGGSPEMI